MGLQQVVFKVLEETLLIATPECKKDLHIIFEPKAGIFGRFCDLSRNYLIYLWFYCAWAGSRFFLFQFIKLN